ncbi:unnamed protein product [Linum trigynum]|uniref:F-box domain-containing protein n=2 Tax=Linum trigynum TaxID=586398 RepID=A0AAV2G019_9ROSI
MAPGSVFSGDGKEEEEEDSGCVDRISDLPEGILMSILSLLTLKDAIRTSLLSHRWVGLWMSALTVLDFDSRQASHLPDEDRPHPKLTNRPAFKQWVDGVVRQLKDASSSTSKLTKFRVSFQSSRYRYDPDWDFDEWLQFAVSKSVEALDLSSGYIKTQSGLSDFKSLRSLRLNSVRVDDKTIEQFISNCPCLEELAVYQSESLKKLRIAAAATGSSSSSLALKRLEFLKCRSLNSLEIDNVPCLTHFTFQGCKKEHLRLENCVSLVDVNIGFECDGLLWYYSAFDDISCYAGQLLSLTVNISPSPVWKAAEFTRLKLMTIEDFDHLSLPAWVNGCPQLHTLRLKMINRRPWYCYKERREPPLVTGGSRESIKVVEIFGFNGYRSSRELMEYLLRCFVGVERIVVRINSSSVGRHQKIFPYTDEEVEETRKLALEFQSKALPAIDYVIIDE